jgi:hypothetical protein
MQLMSRAGDYPDDGEVERHASVIAAAFLFRSRGFIDAKRCVFIGTIHGIASHDALSVKVHLKGVDRDSKSLDACPPDQDHESWQVNLAQDLMMLTRLLGVFPKPGRGRGKHGYEACGCF